MARPQQESSFTLWQGELCNQVASSEPKSTVHWERLGKGRGYHIETGHRKGRCHRERSLTQDRANSSCPANFCRCLPLAKSIWKYNSLWSRVEQGKGGNWIWEQTGKWQAHWSTLRGTWSNQATPWQVFSCLSVIICLDTQLEGTDRGQGL